MANFSQLLLGSLGPLTRVPPPWSLPLAAPMSLLRRDMLVQGKHWLIFPSGLFGPWDSRLPWGYLPQRRWALPPPHVVPPTPIPSSFPVVSASDAQLTPLLALFGPLRSADSKIPIAQARGRRESALAYCIPSPLALFPTPVVLRPSSGTLFRPPLGCPSALASHRRF